MLRRKVTALGPTRNKLIPKETVRSPSHGDTAFAVPLFDEFMRRIMPGDHWRITGCAPGDTPITRVCASPRG